MKIGVAPRMTVLRLFENSDGHSFDQVRGE